MDIRVQELLEKIKREGVESAEARAAEILKDAEAEKRRILEAAEKESRAIVEKGKAEAAKAEASGRAALLQASRDLLISFRSELEKVLASIVRADTDAAMDPEVLKKAIPAILEAWAKDGRDELSVLLPEATLKALDAYFRDRLSAQLKKGAELKPVKDLKSGFRLSEKGGAVYYDFSAEAVASMLGAYMNARLAAIAAEAAK